MLINIGISTCFPKDYSVAAVKAEMTVSGWMQDYTPQTLLHPFIYRYTNYEACQNTLFRGLRNVRNVPKLPLNSLNIVYYRWQPMCLHSVLHLE